MWYVVKGSLDEDICPGCGSPVVAKFEKEKDTLKDAERRQKETERFCFYVDHD